MAVIRVIGSAVGLALKLIRKPDVRNLPVRFDERGKETMRCYVTPGHLSSAQFELLMRLCTVSPEKEQFSILGNRPDLVVYQSFQFIDRRSNVVKNRLHLVRIRFGFVVGSADAVGGGFRFH